MKLPVVFILCSITLLLIAPLRADVNSDLAFSAFAGSPIDLDSLAGGNVLQSRGGLINFQRGVTTQSLYVINAPIADVQTKLLQWNPSTHSELKVWLQQKLPANPALTDFTALGKLPDNSSVGYQISETAKAADGTSSFLIDKSEQDLIVQLGKQQKDPKPLYAKVWSQILLKRLTSFLNGQAAADHYLVDGEKISPMSDIHSLLHSDYKVYPEFQNFFNQTPLRAKTASPKPLPAHPYFGMFDVQGYGSLCAGAQYLMPKGTGAQFLDAEFFINSGVFATVEIDELWPVTIKGKPATLIWRGDMVAAPSIAYLRGTERLASNMIMLQEVKDVIDAFRSEFK